MDFNTTYNKIITDENLMETIQHGNSSYPFHYYYDNLSLFDFNCVDWHWHTEFEFVFVEKGTITFSVGEDQFLLTPGKGVFINSRILHRFYAAEEGIMPNFVCAPSFIAPEDSLIYQKFVFPVISFSAPYQIFTPEVPWQKDILDLMVQMMQAHAILPVDELLISSLLQHLWDILFKHTQFSGQASSCPARSQVRLQVMMQYIHDNYAHPVSLADIAASVSLSKSSTLSLFHSYLHMTPVVYLIRYRLKVAAKLLLSTEKNVAVIAQETGFDNVGYFCRKFKEYYQMTPTQYRRNSR